MSSQAQPRDSATDVERNTVGADAGKLRNVSPGALAVRFFFGALVSAVAGLVATALGQRAGGVLLAFPAILPAALTLIERRESTSKAVSDVRGAVAGALGLLIFAITVTALASRMPVLAALALAALFWIGASATLYFGGRALVRILGEEQYLPDVSVSEAQPLVEALRARGLTVAVAESCTGGALAALLTAVPKASAAVHGGIVAYSNESKRELLDVPPDVLEKHGAVSEATARSMADGARTRLKSDVGISVTGVIGTPIEGEKPGTMIVCAAGTTRSVVEWVEAEGSPEACRAEAIRVALKLALKVITAGP